MASNYPTSLDSFTDPLSNSPLNSPSHAGQHQDLNNSVEQLETKLGTGASPAASATANKVLVANGSGGSSWAAVPEYSLQTGLVYITSVTLGTTVTATTVAMCFSSAYDNYVVSVANVAASTGSSVMYFKLGTGSAGSFTPTANGFYGNTFYIPNGGAGALSNAPLLNSSYCEVGSMTNNGVNGFTFQVNQPNLAARTFTNFTSADDYYMRFGAFQHNSTTQFTGFQVLPGAGTQTGGTITVFGYRKI